MEILNITELHPNYGSCKSFYGKAHILDCGDKFVLRSYETNVAYVDKENKTLHRLWDDWSATTGRHALNKIFITLVACPRIKARPF